MAVLEGIRAILPCKLRPFTLIISYAPHPTIVYLQLAILITQLNSF